MQPALHHEYGCPVNISWFLKFQTLYSKILGNKLHFLKHFTYIKPMCSE